MGFALVCASLDRSAVLPLALERNIDGAHEVQYTSHHSQGRGAWYDKSQASATLLPLLRGTKT